MNKKYFLNAFTMTELLAGIFLTTIAAGAIIIGSVHAKKTIYNAYRFVNVEENVFFKRTLLLLFVISYIL